MMHGTTAHPPILGPAYELVETNNDTTLTHTYTVIDSNQQRGTNRNRAWQLNDHDQPLNRFAKSAPADQDYTVTDHIAGEQMGRQVQQQGNYCEREENNYQVLEESRELEIQSNTGEEHYYHVLENNSSTIPGRVNTQQDVGSDQYGGSDCMESTQFPQRARQDIYNLDSLDYEMPIPNTKS